MRIAQLDGLRAIAILMVFALHHEIFKAGWMGVDLFFCLSGFLITGILRKSRDQQAYWKPFYIKRAARILPPFLIVLIFCFAVSRHMKWIALLGYGLFGAGIMNLTRYYVPELMMLWSLAIEEHFYFVWPAFVRRFERTTLLRLLMILVLLSPLLRFVVSPWVSGYFLYFLTPFHLDSMLWGCILALLLETAAGDRFVRRFSTPLALGGIAFVILVLKLADLQRLNRTTLYSFVGLASFGIVGHLVTQQDSWFSRALRWKPLVWLGAISYGFYLYQQPVISIMAHVFHYRYPYGPYQLHRLLVPDAIATLGISWLSYISIERAAMNRGRRAAGAIAKTPAAHSRQTVAEAEATSA